MLGSPTDPLGTQGSSDNLILYSFPDYQCEIDPVRPKQYFAFSKSLDAAALQGGDPIDIQIMMNGYYQVKLYKLANLMGTNGLSTYITNIELSETRQVQIRSLEILDPSQKVAFKAKIIKTL